MRRTRGHRFGLLQLAFGDRDNPADYDRLKIKGAGGIVPQEHEMLGWVRTCACETEDIVPCTVLDPFMGAATTLLVADKLGRSSIGIELNPEYAKIAESRLEESRRERYAPWQEEYVTPDKEDAPVEMSSRSTPFEVNVFISCCTLTHSAAV